MNGPRRSAGHDGDFLTHSKRHVELDAFHRGLEFNRVEDDNSLRRGTESMSEACADIGHCVLPPAQP